VALAAPKTSVEVPGDERFSSQAGSLWLRQQPAQFWGIRPGLPVVPTGIIVPVAGIWLTDIIGDRPGMVVIVVGLVVPVTPGVIMWLVVGVVAHWPLAHGALADVVRSPQQVLHPTAPNSTRLATPAACKSFFI
jgi:hypothetical protein